MALKRQISIPLNAINVISEHDDSLDLEKSKLEEYKKTGDLSKLVFLPGKQPTIFLCNFNLKMKQSEKIKNSSFGGTDDDGKPTIALGSYSFRVVKYTLKDIQNPEGLEESEKITFKKDQDGSVSDELIAELEAMGVVNEIFGMYTQLVLVGAKANSKN